MIKLNVLSQQLLIISQIYAIIVKVKSFALTIIIYFEVTYFNINSIIIATFI